jgi:hypothetical protein
MIRRGIAVLALLVITAQLGAQTTTPPSPDSIVHLRFGWPVGTTAAIEAGRFRVRNSEGKADTTALTLTYRMSVHDHAAGRAIRYDEFEFDEFSDNESLRGAVNEQLASLMPSLLVDTSGAFVQVENVTALKALMDSLLFKQLPKDSLPPQTRALLENMTSAEVLNALAAQEWNAMIGTWTGADLELGAVYESTEAAPIPIFPGRTLPMVSQFTAAERVECVEGSGKHDCVELRMVSTPDADSVAALMKQMMEAAVNMPETPAFQNFNIETVITLVAEPATLLPHYYSMTKTVSARFTVAGESGELSQEEERTYNFSYNKKR